MIVCFAPQTIIKSHVIDFYVNTVYIYVDSIHDNVWAVRDI